MFKGLGATCIAVTVLWYVDDQHCNGMYLRALGSMLSTLVQHIT